MDIIKQWTEFGHTFIIERLAEPRQQGASLRHFRLWDNGHPAGGGQWHVDLESAEARAQYVLRGDYADRISWLEQRVQTLDNHRATFIAAFDALIAEVDHICYDGDIVARMIELLKKVRAV